MTDPAPAQTPAEEMRAAGALLRESPYPPADTALKLYKLIQLLDALGQTPTAESEQESLAKIAALDDRTVDDLVRMIRRARESR